jgi:hypothetical protein
MTGRYSEQVQRRDVRKKTREKIREKRKESVNVKLKQ